MSERDVGLLWLLSDSCVSVVVEEGAAALRSLCSCLRALDVALAADMMPKSFCALMDTSDAARRAEMRAAENVLL